VAKNGRDAGSELMPMWTRALPVTPQAQTASGEPRNKAVARRRLTNVALDLTTSVLVVLRSPTGISAVATGTIGLSRLPAVIVQQRKLAVSLGFSLVRCSVARSPKGPDDFRIVETRLASQMWRHDRRAATRGGGRRGE